jgi:hypothetical protein
VRLEAAEPIAGGASGREALASRGAGGAKCKLTPAQLAELEAALEAALDAGPAVWGWDEDQCLTLARIADLVQRPFRVQGAWLVHGHSPLSSAHLLGLPGQQTLEG